MNHLKHRKDYEWLRLSRTLLLDAYWPPFYPKIEFDAERIVEIAKSLFANAVRFGSIAKYTIYQS